MIAIDAMIRAEDIIKQRDARPTPATQVYDIIRQIPRALEDG